MTGNHETKSKNNRVDPRTTEKKQRTRVQSSIHHGIQIEAPSGQLAFQQDGLDQQSLHLIQGHAANARVF